MKSKQRKPLFTPGTERILGSGKHLEIVTGEAPNWPYQPELVRRKNGVIEAVLVLPLIYKNPEAPVETFFIEMRRPASPNGFEWNFPGGVYKKGESFQECAVRELLEETDGLSETRALDSLIKEVQFSSGSYLESYTIVPVEAIGKPTLPTNRREGQMDIITVPFYEALSLATEIQNSHESVDGKVFLALLLHLRKLRI